MFLLDVINPAMCDCPRPNDCARPPHVSGNPPGGSNGLPGALVVKHCLPQNQFSPLDHSQHTVEVKGNAGELRNNRIYINDTLHPDQIKTKLSVTLHFSVKA